MSAPTPSPSGAPPAPIPIPPGRRWRHFRRHGLPAAVWGAATLVVALLLLDRGRRFEHVGLAQALRHEVSAPAEGTIAEIMVRPLEPVAAGAPVARIDGAEVEAELRVVEKELALALAELEAARAGLAGGGAAAVSLAADLRRFQSDEEQRRLVAMELRAAVDSDTVEQERLRLEAERARRLAAEGVLSQADLDNARLSHDVLAARVERNRALLEQALHEQKVAEDRRRQFERRHGAGDDLGRALAPLVEAVQVQEARRQALVARRAALTLRAPVAGEVADVLCRPGQAIVPGEAVAVIVPAYVAEVVAYLGEAEVRSVREGMRVRLARRADPSRSAESVVVRVGASVEAKPQALWRDPRMPEYGLPIAIPAATNLKLTPGEAVLVRLTGH